MAKNGKNGNGRVKEIVERLKKLGENESLSMKISDELEEIDVYFTAEMGYFAKNGKGSHAIRVLYGRTPLLKIRNKVEFEAIKMLINYLEKNPEYVEALDRLNGGAKGRRTRKADEYI